MAKESGLKIGLYILAVALVGASATRASFAEEPGSSTHLVVQSHHFGGTRGRMRDAKTTSKFGLPGRLQARRLPAPGASGLIARNAIGLPVTRHEGIQERSGEPHVVPAQIPARDPPGIAESGIGNLAKTNGGIERPTIARPSASPIVSVPVVQRGAISGVSLIRPSSAPSGLGGKARVVAGINGTNIRPKHP
jgi:hypothetical protein